MTSGYNLDTARNEIQLQKMKDLASRNICVFCPENLASVSDNPIEFKTSHWAVKKNDYPYENTVHHLMLIPDEHVVTFSRLSKVAKDDFATAIAETEKRFKLTSYALGMRSGDFRYNGGSVEHLHAHIVVGDTGQDEHEPVRFKMSSKPKK